MMASGLIDTTVRLADDRGSAAPSGDGARLVAVLGGG